MGGCRCSYKNCRNTTKISDNIHFFHYPVKHRARCIQWIENAGKPSFYDLEEEQLRNKVVCETHFEPKWFPNNQRKRLLQGAIPSLDGESFNDDPLSPMEDSSSYLPPNQYNEVKVVPANDDGTVFVLDTENMFTRSQKIESYIIKNGVLVPSNSNGAVSSKPIMRNTFAKPSTSNSFGSYYSSNETEFVTHVSASPTPSLSKRERDFQQVVVKNELPETPDLTNPAEKTSDHQFLIYDKSETENQHAFEMTNSCKTDVHKVNVVNEQQRGHAPTSQAQAPSKNMVGKNYLRKIKQHSRDIATIKRMLKQKKMVQQKPDIKTVLNMLEQQIPASLFTILSLVLGQKNDLNDDDIEFFTTLHRSSPEVYQLLSDKYKWDLPSVDIVDSPAE